MDIFLLVIGLTVLWFGSELVVRGAIEIADYFKISPIFLGLTVVSLGTDLPETFIVLTGAWHKLQGLPTSNLVIGEILGSSVSQITLILGCVGLFGVITIKKREISRDGAMLLLSVLVLFLVAFNGQISMIDGGILLLIYVYYIVTLFREEKLKDKFKLVPTTYKAWSLLSLIGGLCLLIFGSHMTITQALIVGAKFHIPQLFIGTIIVGLGTSLPELFTAIQAVRKKIGGLAIGSLLGSNIYDALVPISLGSFITPLKVEDRLIDFDIPFLFIASLFVLLLFRGDKKIVRKEAFVLIVLYVVYFTMQFLPIVN